jgi:hypothetical protein
MALAMRRPGERIAPRKLSVLLRATDSAMRLLHLGVAFFCVTGWIPPATRPAHLVLILLIASSWFGLGLVFGFGYCLITTIQWRIKEQLGERPATDSFVKYELDRITRRDLDPKAVDRATQAAFYLSALASFYVNFVQS